MDAPAVGKSTPAPRTVIEFARTLLWKNLALKKRHIVATLCEIMVPMIFIIALGLLKLTTTDMVVPTGWSDTTKYNGIKSRGTPYNLFQTTGFYDEWIPYVSLPYFVQQETSMTGLLLEMDLMSVKDGDRLDQLSSSDYSTCTNGVIVGGLVDTNTSSEYSVPSECAGKIAPYKIAIVPDNIYTRNYFMATMDLWYPRISILNSSESLHVPSFRESATFFDSSSDLEDYITGDDYGSGLANPRIYGAIVFDTIPTSNHIGTAVSMEYTIRLNSTFGDYFSRVPSTSGDPSAVDRTYSGITTDYYSAYAVNGFMTLQTLITRFAVCLPEWDSGSQSTSGVCQNSFSTAEFSEGVDNRLLGVLDSDPMIQNVLAFLSSMNSTTSDTFSALVERMTNETKEALLTPLRQAPQAYLGATVAPFPIEEFTYSKFYSQISDSLPLIFILSYLFIVSRMLTSFIQEKETRMREFMKILGVQENVIIFSWFITYIAILFIGAILQAIAGLAGLFKHSSPILMFVFYFLFGLSALSYAFLISSLFSKSRTGALVGMVLFFVMYFVTLAFKTSTPETPRTIGCLLSPVALSLGITNFADAESSGRGVGFGDISTLDNYFRINTALFMFIFDSILYTLLGLYFEKVMPKDYGTSLKWYFPFSISYWRGRYGTKGGFVKASAKDPLLQDVALDVNPNFEPVNADLRQQEVNGEALVVKHIRKVFSVPGGEKVAVNGVNLTMYKNQITCLLGHNGAGKTTLISMLTGMTAPTSGDATFNGLSLTNDMEAIRQSLGICFQHDVLFPELTVEEHLLIFGRIKGYRDAELQTIVDTQIREVGLTEKRHVKSAELSGGMKRKLSVAISLLGDSSLVFLDEPTSGMDPYSRRSTWEILLNNRNDRVMVLTTHFMDEADILGDRICIMVEGEVRCAGSSLFLKNRFGAGYNLTVVKDDAKCVDSNVISFVTSFVPSAQVLSNVGSEIAFQLPIDSSGQFAAMFARMDAEMEMMGLLSYGVSVTTLEEVFIKVAEMDDDANQHTLTKAAHHGADDLPILADEMMTQSDRNPTFGLHLKALLLKRFRYARRDKKSMVYSTAMPILLLLTGLGLMKRSGITSNDPNLLLSTADYSGNSTPTPFYCQADEGSWCSSVMDSSYFTGAATESVSLPDPAFSTDSPTVFGVTYTDPTIDTTDATGYGLALGEVLFNRGYGVGSDLVEGQFGSLLVYGDSESKLLGYNLFANSSGTHASVVFKSLMDQAIYRFFGSNTSNDAAESLPSLTVNSHPLPLTASSKALLTSVVAFASSALICIAFTFFPATIVVFIVKEKQANQNAKHQQVVSGVSLGAFWLSNYIWDLIMYAFPLVAAIVLIKAFDIATLTGSSDCVTCTSETFPAVILLFVLYGLAICPFTYCLSYLFKEHTSSQTFTVMINFVLGVVLMIVSFILDEVNSSTSSVNKVLKFFWRFSPLFNVGNGLLNMVVNEFDASYDSETNHKSPYSGDLMGYELLYLAITAICYFSLAVGIDYAMTIPKFKHAMVHHDDGDKEQVELDPDVVSESERVARGDADNDFVKLHNLRKVYPGGKIAVRNLSFGLKRGECFGFLGINGAGKTTTMKMLTGDELPTYGHATLAGYDIMTQQIEVRRQIGYCPQFDALFDLLTVREHLELYGSIKGMSGAELDQVVSEKIEQMNLVDFENKLAGSLSGGNKRKLSVAIAMIGSPRIIFLDEPSTGMDPVSRRFMWDVIAGISTRGKSSTIVLTTHSMEEAEALCSRVGIMVGGRMRCLGSVQHLKSRFGDGLVFDIKLNMPTQEELEYLVQEVFGTPGANATPAELADKCEAFGNRRLADRIVASHPTGFNLFAAIERDGYVRAEAFCSWCIEETRFDTLEKFLVESFGTHGATLMERQNDFCRFKLRGSTGDLKLSKVFALIEDAKDTLEIREYSVSQTTLEQIFNGFASKQEEEQGVARGVYKVDEPHSSV